MKGMGGGDERRSRSRSRSKSRINRKERESEGSRRGKGGLCNGDGRKKRGKGATATGMTKYWLVSVRKAFGCLLLGSGCKSKRCERTDAIGGDRDGFA